MKFIKDIFGNSYKIIWNFKIKHISLHYEIRNKQK